MDKEIWMMIPEWEKYSISNYGNVKNNTTGLILKHTIRKGYHGVTLYNGNRFKIIRVHAYMVRVFKNNWNKKLVAAHVDGNKNNNSLENIELITQSENIEHKHIHNTMAIGPKNYNSKFTFDQVREIKRLLKLKDRTWKTPSYEKIAKMYGVCPNAIWNIANGRAYAYINIDDETEA